MNTGVEILLKRMADCPEDFYYHPDKGMSRWSRLVDHAVGEELLTEEEHDALIAGLKETKRVRFTELVMKELAGVEDVTSEEGKTPMSIALKNATLSDGLTLTSAVADAQKYQSEMMRRHLDEHRKALKSESRENKSKLMEMLDSYVEYGKKKATQR